jgi:ribosomal protein L33
MRQATNKLMLRKYDPLVNMHVVFKESKLSSGKKR